MPVSKHRKKGQAKAVRKPGKARVKQEPGWLKQQHAIEQVAFEMMGADTLPDDEFDTAEEVMELILDEVLAISVSGEALTPRIGSREAVVEAYCAAGEDVPPVPGEVDADRAEVEAALARFEACGFVRFDEDQLILNVPIPEVG